MDTVEKRLEKLKRGLKCYRNMTIGLVLALAGMVTVAATESDVVDEIRCRSLKVVNKDGGPVVAVQADDDGNGALFVVNKDGELVVVARAVSSGSGRLAVSGRDGKGGVAMQITANGGMLDLINKTGEEVVQLYADEYGNGVVGAWNRKGKGHTLQPGP